jgi:hypothetical protein
MENFVKRENVINEIKKEIKNSEKIIISQKEASLLKTPKIREVFIHG